MKIFKNKREIALIGVLLFLLVVISSFSIFQEREKFPNEEIYKISLEDKIKRTTANISNAIKKEILKEKLEMVSVRKEKIKIDQKLLEQKLKSTTILK